MPGPGPPGDVAPAVRTTGLWPGQTGGRQVATGYGPPAAGVHGRQAGSGPHDGPLPSPGRHTPAWSSLCVPAACLCLSARRPARRQTGRQPGLLASPGPVGTASPAPGPRNGGGGRGRPAMAPAGRSGFAGGDAVFGPGGCRHTPHAGAACGRPGWPGARWPGGGGCFTEAMTVADRGVGGCSHPPPRGVRGAHAHRRRLDRECLGVRVRQGDRP